MLSASVAPVTEGTELPEQEDAATGASSTILVVLPLATPPRYSKCRQAVCAAIGGSNGGLSYGVSAAAFPALEAMGFNLEFLKTMAAFSCICYGTFVRKTFLELRWKPRGVTQVALASFSPFASAPLFTGAYVGSHEYLKFSENVSLIIGLFLFAFRVLTYTHNAINLPRMLGEIKQDFIKAYQQREILKMVELTLITLNALLYSYIVIDSAYAALGIILNWWGVAAPPQALLLSVGTLGSIGTFPLALCSFNNGMKIVKTRPLALLIPMLLFTCGSSIGAVGSVVARKNPPVNSEIFGFSPAVIAPIAAASACLYATLLGGVGLESIATNIYNRVKQCGSSVARRVTSMTWFSSCCSRRRGHVNPAIEYEPE